MHLGQIETVFERATNEIGKVVIGQHELVEATLIAVFCEGNVLIEGVPGLGKTLLVNTLSRVLSCEFRRIQFTPDLMPSDVTGHSIYDMRENTFNFNRGPVFTNLLLADEINRAPAKTQSALLEAMQERQVTVDGVTYPLDRPFLTIATQNPLEQEGTYPLPEAQLDRFMFKLLVDYPLPDQEAAILGLFAEGKDTRNLDMFDVSEVIAAEQVALIQDLCKTVIVEQTIIRYITALVVKDAKLAYGGSRGESAGRGEFVDRFPRDGRGPRAGFRDPRRHQGTRPLGAPPPPPPPPRRRVRRHPGG